MQQFNFLKLIKDWDFAAISNVVVPDFWLNLITTNQNNVIEYVKSLDTDKFHNEGSVFVMVRRFEKAGRWLTPDNEYMYEMSVKPLDDGLDNLEIPITAMKVELTHENIVDMLILSICLDILKSNTSDIKYLDTVNEIMKKKTTIIINKSQNGLFHATTLSTTTLTKHIYDMIYKTVNHIQDPIIKNNISQFLISQIIQSDRLFYRFKCKNIKKIITLLNF